MYCDWIYQSPTLSLCIGELEVGTETTPWFLPCNVWYQPYLSGLKLRAEDYVRYCWVKRKGINMSWFLRMCFCSKEWSTDLQKVFKKSTFQTLPSVLFFFSKRSTVESKVPETASWLVHKSSARQRKVLYEDIEVQESTADCVLAGAYVFCQAKKSTVWR